MRNMHIITKGKAKSSTVPSLSKKQVDSDTKLDGIRLKLFLDRYSLKDKNGSPIEKRPEEMWLRVAKSIASVEKSAPLKKHWEKVFYDAMLGFKFCPAGRFLTSAGAGSQATTINCYVIPSPEDTRHGIIQTLEHVTEISARGGGVGFNISTLRPRNSYLKSVNGTSSGAVSWSELYSIAAHDIIQQGGTRRGALMMMMWDWHPDIEEFITVKKQKGKMLGANLSVCISDAFMEAVKKDADWRLVFPDTDFEKYRKEWKGDMEEWQKKGYPVKLYKTIKARYIWDLICESAWASAEPGIVFMDRYNQMNNSWYFEKNIATNPCGEQGLPAWGVCNLSSVNLAAFVNDSKFDFKDFERVVAIGTRFLDNGVDAEKYLNRDVESQQKGERRLGLGTIGLADALIKMKVRYGSKDSFTFIDEVFARLRDVSYRTSIDLAREKGAFKKFDARKFLQGKFIQTLPEDIKRGIKKYGIRNCFLVTEAPTGKISLLAGVSSGIEPVFSYSYKQKDRLGERVMYHPLYQEWITKNKDKEVPDYFVTADDLTPDEHIQVQAIIQKYTDSSISKTVNAPKSHTVADVKKLYTLAYETGCKGVSYMREGSRDGTLERTSENEVKEETKAPLDIRPFVVPGSTYRLETPVGIAFITINETQNGEPMELFINVGKAGSDVQAMAQALGRTISAALRFRSNVGPKERAREIAMQLAGIGGRRSVGFGPTKVLSLPDAVACAISMHFDFRINGFLRREPVVNQNTPEKPDRVLSNSNGHLSVGAVTGVLGQVMETDQKKFSLGDAHSHVGDICPSCGSSSLVFQESCSKCFICGHSEC